MTIVKRIASRLKRHEKKDGTEHFFNRHYQMHNVKRLGHLESLGLDLCSKRVLEIGAGIGDHTYYYLTKNCSVVTTDARPNLVEFIKKRFEVEAFVFNAETDLNRLAGLEKFDVIHCYGLLYHIQNPSEFIRSLKGKCRLLLLETCVSNDFREYGPHIVDENKSNQTQSVSGKGCRPTRKWIFDRLKEEFEYVYMPYTQPDHAEFPKKWESPVEDRTCLIRAVFVASESEIINANLSLSIPLIYQ